MRASEWAAGLLLELKRAEKKSLLIGGKKNIFKNGCELDGEPPYVQKVKIFMCKKTSFSFFVHFYGIRAGKKKSDYFAAKKSITSVL